MVAVLRKVIVGVWHRQKLRSTREASNGGRVRVRIIHGLNISHKELIYLLQKSTSHQNEALHACSQGDRLVGKYHRLSPTATHKVDNQRNTSCFIFVTQRLPYMHATGLANLNTSIYQIHNYSNSMTLISSSSYLKTIIKNQTSHSIQCTYMKVFIIPILDAHHIRTNFIAKANYHAVLKDSQNNICEE